MLGSEGTGLSRWLSKKAEFTVGLKSSKDIDEVGVESLNVSVAAALLAAEFLRDLPAGPQSRVQNNLVIGNEEENLGF
jgi:21S rRNA (GM2251-2'-O)-methyltransferase